MLLIELVWRLLRWQPDYPPVRKLVEGVAAARRVAIDIWRLSTGRTTSRNSGW